MIKKIKENQYVKIVRELLQNRRTSAMAKLILWLFFFLIIFALFDVRGTKKPKKEVFNPRANWATMTNYKSEIAITKNEETYIFKDIRYGDYEKLTISEDTYYLEQNFLYHLDGYDKVFQQNTSLLEYDFLKLRPDFFNEVVLNSKLEYTTNYESGKVVKGYSINTAKFVELYQGTTITDDSFVTIEITEQDEKVIKLSIDLKEVQKYSQEMIQTYKIEIVYSDIGIVSKEEVE